ncbi:MAG: hypothetical protein NUV75_06000 [Gallionella sp.]|nr:hypothetical protein [Gallionella sp.]
MSDILTRNNHGLSPVMPLLHKAAGKLLAIFFILATSLFFQNAVFAAVAHDAASESHTTGATGSTNQASFTWTHTPVGTPRGVLVFVFTRSATQTVTGVTYGGVAMTEIAGGAAVDTAGEPGRVDTFFLGAAIPTGARPVVVTRTNNATVMYASAATQTAGANTEVYTPGIILLQQNGAYAVQSVTDGSTGVNSVRYAGGYSGGANVLAAGAGSTILNNIDIGSYTFNTVRETTAGQGARNVGFTYGTSDDRAGVHLAVRELPPVTTLATGTDPAAATIAPGAAATDVDLFTLQTASGTEAITSVTVNLSTSSGVGRLAITNNAGTELGFTTTPVTGSNTIAVAGMTATTTLTTFRIRVTPLSHAAMPLPPGAVYDITAPVTAWAGPNTHAGSDTNPDALTIDNFSPVGATSAGGTAGNAQVTLDWTTSASPDLSRSVMLRWTASTAGAAVPAEGIDYVNGNTIGTATVVCVRTADAASAAVSGVDGAGSGGCSATPLVNGNTYTYKIFQKDSNGNYDAGVEMGTFTPPYPSLTCVTSSFTGADNSAPDSINWDVQNVSGTFTPVIFGNRLRITDITGSVSTRATNKNLFPFGNNFVVAEFDYWAYGGTGADGIAVTFSNPNTPTPGANNPPTAGGFGGSLGYANRDTAGTCNVPGFSGGWIGVGIDEYGNYSNPTECRNGGPGPRVNAVSVRGSGNGAASPSTSNYAYVTGTAALGANGVASGTSVTPYRYRITLDSVTDLAKVMVKVEQDKTGAGYLPLFSYDLKPLITAGTQAPLPSQLQFTLTGSTGGSTNYHEIDNLSICSASVVSALNHVAIDAPATAATLTDVPVIIEPHDAAHTPVDSGSTISLSTSTASGDWNIGTGTGTFTPGAADSGLATYTFAPGETSVTLDFNYQTAGLVTINVADAGGGDLLLNTPAGEKANTIDFTASSFVFTDSACVHNIAFGAPGQTCTILGWSPQVAGQNLANVYITAVNAAGVPTRLSTANRTRNMRFGLSCHDPAAHAGIQATFGAVTLPLCEANGAMPTAWSATLAAFFPGGIPSAGPYIFNYADVGAVNLWMQNSASLGQVGASGTFVVKPGGFVLSGIMRTSDSFANPAAADAAGVKFVKAGEMFSVTVTATTCAPASATCTVAGVATPNYGNETAAESVMLASALVAPAGGSNPAVGGAFGAFGAAHPSGLPAGAGGVAHGTAFTWDEVGIINLTPSVGDGDYLGLGDVTGTASGNVGRFFPDHFALSGMPIVNRILSGCVPDSSFTYAGEEFQATFTLEARNAANIPTANYLTANGYAKLDGTAPTNFNFGAIDLADAVPPLTATPSVVLTLGTSSGSWTAGGQGTFNVNLTVNRAAAPDPDGPFESFNLGVDPIDTDGVKLASYNLDVNNDATNDHSLVGASKIRFGRLKLSNAHGSELLNLPIPIQTQYWNGISFVTNGEDYCTQIGATNIGLANYTKNLALGETVISTGTAFNAGVGSLILSKPGATNDGSVDLVINLSATATEAPCITLTPDPVTVGANLGYLRGKWCGAAYDKDPSVRATFGVYKGNNEFIYLRESY